MLDFDGAIVQRSKQAHLYVISFIMSIIMVCSLIKHHDSVLRSLKDFIKPESPSEWAAEETQTQMLLDVDSDVDVDVDVDVFDLPSSPYYSELEWSL